MIKEKIKAIKAEMKHLDERVLREALNGKDFEKNREKRKELLKEWTKLERKQREEEQKISKVEKERDRKFKKAFMAGARVVEESISKVGWDIGSKKVKEVQNRLDYKAYWVLDCAADMIANEWYVEVMFGRKVKSNNVEERLDRAVVMISYKEFTDFIGRKEISTAKATEMFKRMPLIVLEGDMNIPSANGWIKLEDYRDNICGVVVAHESKAYAEYRSNRKLRSRGAGKEEPVFILIFSNIYGMSFFHNARNRKGCQIQNVDLYKLKPEAQELFQKIRWNEGGPVIMNVERISRAVRWTWPPKDFYDRVKRCRKLLDLLYKKNFINRPIERGKSIEEKDWLFYVSKGRGVITEKHRMKLIKNAPNGY